MDKALHRCLTVALQGLIIAVLQLSWSSPAFARDYYVDDSSLAQDVATLGWGESLSKPYRTIQYAVNKAIAGDTVNVLAGTYTGWLRFDKSGAPGAPITLKNYAGQKVVLDIQGYTVPGAQVLLQNKLGDHYEIGWITIEGLEIRNGYVGIKMYNGHDIIIRGNKIIDNALQGILGNGTRITFDRNIIAGTALRIPKQTSTLEHGIYFTGNNNIVSNNIFHSNLGYGIQIAGYPYEAEYAGDTNCTQYCKARGWLISNNVFAFQRNRGAITIWQAGATDNIIQNNLFFNNSTSLAGDCPGITFVEDGGAGTKIRNNLNFSSFGGAAVCNAPVSIAAKTSPSGQVYEDSGTDTRNPLLPNFLTDRTLVNFQRDFVPDPALVTMTDFRPQLGSPLIDGGCVDNPSTGGLCAAAAIRVDIEGTTRPSGARHDIGAFEKFVTTIPLAPARLRIE